MPICACLGGKAKAQAVKVQPEGPKIKDEGNKKKKAGDCKKVYVTRNIHEDALAILEEKFEVIKWDFDEKVSREKLMQDIHDVSAIICTIADEIDEEVLSAAGPSLKLICSMTSAVNHIDEEACRRRGIVLHHLADLCADTTAELTVALLLVTCRRLMEGHDAVVQGTWGDWKPLWLIGSDLRGKTLGFLGFGRVGSRVAKRLEAFNMERMIYYSLDDQLYEGDTTAERVGESDQIFTESDFIICCLSLSEETRHFVNKENLSLCKPECVLVNTSRAEIINQDDLVVCLDEGIIAGAGLDVTTPEPLPMSHPLLLNQRCVVTPHMGTATTATRRRMAVHLANTVADELSA